MADRCRSRSRSRNGRRPTYLSTHEERSAIAEEPVNHNQVMWLVKELYWGASWYREAIHFRDQLEKQYVQGIGIEHGELIWLSEDGDVKINYYTHDFTKKPWTQTRFWDEDRVHVKHEKEIVRVLKSGTHDASIEPQDL